MARKVNKKCQQCAALDVESAIALHGPEGDHCWNPGNIHNWGYDCHRRRSHYRRRDDINAVRRRLRRAGVSPSQLPSSVECTEVSPPIPEFAPAAVLVLYRQHPDAPVHAVAAEVWRGEQKVAEVKPVHCMGMRGDRVSAYIKDLLKSLNQQFEVTRFEDVIKNIPVERCPIDHCPLRV